MSGWEARQALLEAVDWAPKLVQRDLALAQLLLPSRFQSDEENQ
ncbi:MAG: hypothetical protein R2749_17475 [Acidimicrobiales bacterium]